MKKPQQKSQKDSQKNELLKQPSSGDLYEKTVSSEQVYGGHFLKIQKDEVLLPGGKKSYREYIKHPGASMVIPRLDNGNVIVLRQYRHACRQIFWEFPAGKIDAGEEPLLTAHRELEEETGFRAGKMRYLTSIHPVIGYADEIIHLYIAEELTFVGARPDEGEHMHVVEKSKDELMQMLRRGEVTDVKTQIGLFWLDKSW